MKLRSLSMCALAAATLGLAPDLAFARHHHYREVRHYSESNCHARRSTHGAVGAVVGGVGGGVVGGALTHGSVVGVLAGAAGGALAGHAIGKHTTHC